jgi:hypothetical protein
MTPLCIAFDNMMHTTNKSTRATKYSIPLINLSIDEYPTIQNKTRFVSDFVIKEAYAERARGLRY